MNQHNYIYLVWKNPETHRNYIIGKLTRNNGYVFEYCEEFEEAKKSGWKMMDAFPKEERYESDTLFAAFQNRLPDAKRRDIDKILKKYDLSEYDSFELLRVGGGRLPIDTYEFVDPIFPDEETICRRFYVVGIRYNSGCNGSDCSVKTTVKTGDELILELEPENISDEFAVKILSTDGKMIGYIPRYYSKSVTMRIKKGMTYSCRIIEIGESCENCIKVELKMPKTN